MYRLTLLLSIIALASAAGWSYRESDQYGPSKWKDIPGADCGKSAQSPIDIDTSQVVQDPDLGTITFTDFDKDPRSIQLRNNGHTVQVDIMDADMKISGGGLVGEYKTAQFHFHWGADSGKGSEHTINGNSYPIEMHVVSYNTKYANLSYAADKPDGLAVLGLMFVVGDENPAFNQIVDNMDKVRFKDEKITIPAFKTDVLFGSRDRSRFYRYKGSLTTPSCWESAMWTVFAEAQSISEAQLDTFRSVYEFNDTIPGENNTVLPGENNTVLINNFRPVQPLNNRTVMASRGPWSYHGPTGPQHWPTWYEKCGGQQQSPVDIVTSQAKYNISLGPIHLGKYKTPPSNLTLYNNGHTAQVNLNSDAHQSISGGGLPYGDYQAAQFHFHWGSDDNKGSEHTIDGTMLPLELHIVHFNTKYGSLPEAVNKSDGLAVLGFLFTISEEDNPVYDKILDHLEDVKYKGDKAELSSTFPLEDLFRQVRQARYYRYPGSLTTPPCHESVTWTVFADAVTISKDQLAKFREIYEEKKMELGNTWTKMENNFRPVQSLSGRTVEKSWMMPEHPPQPCQAPKTISSTLATFLVMLFLVMTVH